MVVQHSMQRVCARFWKWGDSSVCYGVTCQKWEFWSSAPVHARSLVPPHKFFACPNTIIHALIRRAYYVCQLLLGPPTVNLVWVSECCVPKGDSLTDFGGTFDEKIIQVQAINLHKAVSDLL